MFVNGFNIVQFSIRTQHTFFSALVKGPWLRHWPQSELLQSGSLQHSAHSQYEVHLSHVARFGAESAEISNRRRVSVGKGTSQSQLSHLRSPFMFRQAYETEAKACPDLRLLKFSNHLPLQIPVELACALHHPGLCMHAFCEPAALLLSMNMTRTHSRCNATSGDTLRSKGRT